MQEVRRPSSLLPPHADLHACSLPLPPEATIPNPRLVLPRVRLVPHYACHRTAPQERRNPWQYECDPGTPYRTLMGIILTTWHAADTTICMHRPGSCRPDLPPRI